MNIEINSCPYCGSDAGFRRTIRTEISYDWDNNEVFRSNMPGTGKTAWCLSCNKQLFQLRLEEGSS